MSDTTQEDADGSGHDWDAATYDRVSDPQFGWALEQLQRLELAGDEIVLDAGCGSGRVTEVIAGRVPDGRVYAVDLAPSMVEHTRRRLGSRATALCQDLIELRLPEPVDVAFSSATFHWIADHEALFAALHRSLREGGRLVAQCGGRGNIEAFRHAAESVTVEEPFEHYFSGWRRPWNYASPEDTVARLKRVGFVRVGAWLEPKQVVLEKPHAFVETVCLTRHLDRLPESLRPPFVDRVLARTGLPVVLDYVRLNLQGKRSA